MASPVTASTRTAKFGGVEIAQGHAEGKGAPLAQCQADAIAAVEQWKDSIR